ncbi:hypothetical protein V6N12_032987 [Hibiscus sabdariffa]|uniref:non-specific serine/threonine protein kinase n=1 Tax=Hibiscus sabdariffa TaxID=183260 RepID=A0ABR2AKR4_9ROSI
MKTHSKNPVFVSLLSFIFLLYSFAQFCYASSDTLRQMPDPDNECELYNFCGNYSTCDQFDSRKCVCLEGFRPKSQDQWDARNWHGGCVRKIELQCPSTDDGTSRGKGDLDTCRRHCLENCSCTAYAFIPGIRCMIWTGDLVDLQRSQQGGSLEFFYRLHHSELDHRRKISNLIIVIVSLVVAGCLAATIWLVWRYKTKLKVSSKLCCKDDDVAVFDVSKNKSKEFTTDLSRPTDILIDGNLVNGQELQNFNFSCIATATKNFCEENRLGQGGFGAVYKAWQLWSEDKAMDLVDPCIRLKMDAVVVFLESEAATLPMPTKPTYTSLRNAVEEEYAPDSQEMVSSNDVTVTTIIGR